MVTVGALETVNHLVATGRGKAEQVRNQLTAHFRAGWMWLLMPALLVRERRRRLLVSLGVGVVVGLVAYLAWAARRARRLRFGRLRRLDDCRRLATAPAEDDHAGSRRLIRSAPHQPELWPAHSWPGRTPPARRKRDARRRRATARADEALRIEHGPGKSLCGAAEPSAAPRGRPFR
jgi:hypothetical protein